jgi:hypothetical protein
VGVPDVSRLSANGPVHRGSFYHEERGIVKRFVGGRCWRQVELDMGPVMAKQVFQLAEVVMVTE